MITSCATWLVAFLILPNLSNIGGVGKSNMVGLSLASEALNLIRETV